MIKKRRYVLIFYDIDRVAGIQNSLKFWIPVLASHYQIELWLARKPSSEVLAQLDSKVKVSQTSVFTHGTDHKLVRSIDMMLGVLIRSLFVRKRDCAVMVDFGSWAWLLNPNIVAYRHFDPAGHPQSKFFLALMSLTSLKRRLVTLTEPQAAWLRRRGFSNVHTLPNFFARQEAETVPRSKRDGFVMAGRNTPQKGYDRVLNSTKRLPISLFVDAQRDLNTAGTCIEIIPRLATKEELRNFEVLLMPSRYEGLPMLAIEFLAAGGLVFHSGIEPFREIFEPHFDQFSLDYDCDIKIQLASKLPEARRLLADVRASILRRYFVNAEKARCEWDKAMCTES